MIAVGDQKDECRRSKIEQGRVHVYARDGIAITAEDPKGRDAAEYLFSQHLSRYEIKLALQTSDRNIFTPYEAKPSLLFFFSPDLFHPLLFPRQRRRVNAFCKKKRKRKKKENTVS